MNCSQELFHQAQDDVVTTAYHKVVRASTKDDSTRESYPTLLKREQIEEAEKIIADWGTKEAVMKENNLPLLQQKLQQLDEATQLLATMIGEKAIKKMID